MQWTSWLAAIRNSVAPSVSARRRSQTTRLEPAETLENRSLLTVTAFFISGQLSVSSDASDDITIRPNPLNQNLVQVLANGAPVSSLPTILASNVSSISVNGGDDQVRTRSTVERVKSVAAIDGVVADSAIDIVVAVASDQRVIAR